MLAVPHPEVLAADWIPPMGLAHAAELDALVRVLAESRHPRPVPLAAVAGPPEAGTSTVARQALRLWAERVGRTAAPLPLSLVVRTRGIRGTATVAGTLLRQFDEGFDPHGFPAAEILAGLFRRIRREGRPTSILLDDLDVASAPLEPILRACAAPDRFLPEGDEGLPELTVIVAGRTEAVDRLLVAARRPTARIPVGLPSPLEIHRILRDRAERALGRVAPEGLVAGIVGQATAEGRGLGRAFDLLRREILGATAVRPGSVYRPLPGHAGLILEEHFLRALDLASVREVVPYAVVHRWEQRLARELGVRPLPPTTLWRRILRLEHAGYLRREIRAGGPGGTRSTIRILTPTREWITVPSKGTLRAFSSSAAEASTGAVGAAARS